MYLLVSCETLLAKSLCLPRRQRFRASSSSTRFRKCLSPVPEHQECGAGIGVCSGIVDERCYIWANIASILLNVCVH